DLGLIRRIAEHLRDDVDVGDEFRRAFEELELARRPFQRERQELADADAVDGRDLAQVELHRRRFVLEDVEVGELVQTPGQVHDAVFLVDFHGRAALRRTAQGRYRTCVPNRT